MFLTKKSLFNWVTTSNNWVNSNRYTYTNTSTGRLTQMITESWNATQNMYVPLQRNIYSYDARGNDTLTLIEKWSTPLSAYQNYEQIASSFTSFDKPDKQLDQFWLTGSWSNSSSATKTYYHYAT